MSKSWFSGILYGMSQGKIGKILAIGGVLMVVVAPLIYWGTVLYPFSLPRLAWFFAAAVVLFVALLFGWQKETRLQLDWFDLFALLWLGLLGISSWLSFDPHTAWWSEAGRAIGLVWIILWFVSYLVARQFVWSAKERRILAIISPIIVALTILWSAFLPQPDAQRISGLFGNPVVYGIYLQMAFCWLAYLWWQKKKLGLDNDWWQVLLVVVGAGTLVALWQTEARAATMGLLCGVIVGVIGWQWQKQRRLIRGLMIGGAIILLLAGSLVMYQRRERFASVFTRWNNWHVAVRAIATKPILGWGWDNYRVATEKLFDPRLAAGSFFETRIDKPHNIFLEVTVVGGFVGLAAYLLMWGALWWKWRQNFARDYWSAGTYWTMIALLVGYFATQFFNFDNLASYGWWWLFWLVGNTDVPTQMTVRVRPGIVRFFAFGLFGAGLAAFYYGGYLPVRQAAYIDEARYAAEQKNLVRIEEMFSLSYAVPAGPYPFEQWRWFTDSLLGGFVFSGWQLNSFAPEVQTQWLADRDKIGQETKRLLATHQDSLLWQLFGGRAAFYLFKAGAGQTYLSVAENAFLQAQKISPSNPEAKFLIATIALDSKQIDKAVAAMQEALLIYTPDSWRLLEGLVAVLQEQKRMSAIVTLYEIAAHSHPTGDIYAKLAAAYAANKQYAAARTAVATAVKLDASLATEAESFLKLINGL